MKGFVVVDKFCTKVLAVHILYKSSPSQSIFGIRWMRMNEFVWIDCVKYYVIDGLNFYTIWTDNFVCCSVNHLYREITQRKDSFLKLYFRKTHAFFRFILTDPTTQYLSQTFIFQEVFDNDCIKHVYYFSLFMKKYSNFNICTVKWFNEMLRNWICCTGYFIPNQTTVLVPSKQISTYLI